jgi:hypothetical protein
MMELIRIYSVILLAMLAPLSFYASAFSGEFEISELEVEAPFQADPKSIDNTTLSCKWLTCPRPKQGRFSNPLLHHTSCLQ